MASGDFERTVDLSRQALADDPTGTSHNDLAAALLLHTSDGGGGRDLAEALDHAARAVDLAPDLLEARANLAFALTSLGVDHAAAEAWKALDGTPFAPLALAYRDAARRDATQPHVSPIAAGLVEMGAWGEGFSSGGEAIAAAHLDRAEALALDAAERGDSTLLESVAAVRTATPEQRSLLAKAHASFHQVRGSAKYASCDERLLSTTLRVLEAVGTPFAAWVAIDQAICTYFTGDLPAARRQLVSSRERWGDDRRPVVAARVDALLALISMLQGHYTEADRRYAAAIDRYRSLGDLGEALYLQALRARNLAFGGLATQAWDLRLPSLRGLLQVSDLERRTNIVQDGVEALEREGLSSAALAVIDEQVEQAARLAQSPTGDGDLLVYTLLRRARLLSSHGRADNAIRDLRRAEATWEELPRQQEIRDRLAVEIGIARAYLGVSGPSAVDDALAFHTTRSPDGLGNRVVLADILRLQAKEAWNRREPEQARASLYQALEELERQRGEIQTPEQRARFAGRSKELVRELVRLLADDLDAPVEALSVWDQYTGRLPRLVQDVEHAPPRSEADFVKLVPEGALVVRWAELPDRLLIWSIDAGGVSLEVREATEQAVAHLVDAFRAAILRPRTETEQLQIGKELAQLILPTGATAARHEKRLVFIPSPSLQRVPFAALPLHDDSYLIERASLAFAPNLAVLADVEDVSPEGSNWSQETSDNQLLLIADPAFDTKEFSLDRLPRAAEGLEDALAGRLSILSGPAATRSAVLDALRGHRVLHAAAHGITDHSFPDRGGVLLARDPSDLNANLLTSADLAKLVDLDLRLVVLATCTSALGTSPGSTDYLGLASAFLGSGVEAVLTTPWSIENENASTFFRNFYAALERETSPVDALRAAQTESIHGPARLATPRSWAGYRIDHRGDPWKSQAFSES